MIASTLDLVRPETPRRTAWTAAFLVAACFPEPKWAVPNLIPAGCSCLAGPPKVGKSWMVLGLAVAVATGGKAFGYQLVTAGPVLYLALEDSPIRLQSRLEDRSGDGDAPEDLHIWTEVERGRPGVDAIEGWLDEHPTGCGGVGAESSVASPGPDATATPWRE